RPFPVFLTGGGLGCRLLIGLARKFQFIQLIANNILNSIIILFVFIADKSNGRSGFVISARATNSMDIIFGVVRYIKVYDERDIIYIDAPRKHISSHHNGMRLILRSEEHTSELQSRFDLVCRLLLEKKK